MFKCCFIISFVNLQFYHKLAAFTVNKGATVLDLINGNEFRTCLFINIIIKPNSKIDNWVSIVTIKLNKGSISFANAV